MAIGPGAVAESVKRGPRVQEIGSSVPCRVKPLTFKIDTCHFLGWHSVLVGYDNDWLAQ